jgi:hypothetical protein
VHLALAPAVSNMPCQGSDCCICCTDPEALEHTIANTTRTDKVFDKEHERAMTVCALCVEFGVFPNQSSCVWWRGAHGAESPYVRKDVHLHGWSVHVQSKRASTDLTRS